MKKYFIMIPVLLIIYLLTLNTDNNQDSLSLAKNVDKIEKNEEKKHLDYAKVNYNGENKEILIDEYVIGVLACEMPASFNLEALKSGAVAARTFYLYKLENDINYVATTNDQCFITEEDMKVKWKDNFNKYYDIIRNAVESTSGEFISYDGKVIQSFYFSMSNGFTEDVQNVFSESKPYLVSVSSFWDKNVSNYEKTVTFKKEDFLSKLGISNSDKLEIKIESKSESGRINFLKINGIEFKGTDFRKKLGIRSTDFDIFVENDEVSITTRGYGHGVGLSQYGANEMAKLGYTYKDILKHYYTGVEISTI